MKTPVELYFSLAQERYRIMLAKLSGHPAPWTTDPAFSQFRFCNVHREDDKTTTWYRRNVRKRHVNDPAKTLLNAIVFRWFNRIETAEKLMSAELFDEWNAVAAKKILQGVSPVVTGAYVIKTPDGMSKLDGVLWCVENVRPHIPHIAEAWMHKPGVTLEVACGTLMNYKFLGGFMAHQLVADLKYTPLLSDAPDRLTWAYPGPGTARGAGRLLYGSTTALNPHSQRDRAEIQGLIATLVEFSQSTEYWPQNWRSWEASDASNWLCEFDKHQRVTVDGERMKQRYSPR